MGGFAEIAPTKSEIRGFLWGYVHRSDTIHYWTSLTYLMVIGCVGFSLRKMDYQKKSGSEAGRFGPVDVHVPVEIVERCG